MTEEMGSVKMETAVAYFKLIS